MKSIVKQVNSLNKRRDKRRKIKKWWSEHSYIFYRIILFPIWIMLPIIEKLDNKKQSTHYDKAFSKELTKKYLNKVMPYWITTYNRNKAFPIELGFAQCNDYYSWLDKSFIYNLNLYLHKKNITHISRYFCKYADQIFDYILKEYNPSELSVFRINSLEDWEKASRMFNWTDYPQRTSDFDNNNIRGVIFYLEK